MQCTLCSLARFALSLPSLSSLPLSLSLSVCGSVGAPAATTPTTKLLCLSAWAERSESPRQSVRSASRSSKCLFPMHGGRASVKRDTSRRVKKYACSRVDVSPLSDQCPSPMHGHAAAPPTPSLPSSLSGRREGERASERREQTSPPTPSLSLSSSFSLSLPLQHSLSPYRSEAGLSRPPNECASERAELPAAPTFASVRSFARSFVSFRPFDCRRPVDRPTVEGVSFRE